MNVMDMQSSLSGLANALESQKMVTDLMHKTLHPQQGAQLSQQEHAVQTTQLANAVTGLGSKVDVTV